jgi:hypothetical protein
MKAMEGCNVLISPPKQAWVALVRKVLLVRFLDAFLATSCGYFEHRTNANISEHVRDVRTDRGERTNTRL